MSAHSNAPAPFAGVNATWNYTLGSIVFVFVLLDFLVVTDLLVQFADTRLPAMLALVLLSLVAAATRIRYCWFLRADAGSELPHIGWTVALFAPALVSWGMTFFLPGAALFAAVQLWFSGVLFSLVVPKRFRWPLILLTLVLVLIPIAASGVLWGSVPVSERRPGVVMILIYSALLPFMLVSSLWLWRVVARLDEARHLAAELAVTQERLRFAADLHDIQGHHLQVIALKAELVERTLGTKPEYAAGQAGEIRLIAKAAMEETRSLVSDLREVALGDELENAREVLALSGAESTLDVSALPTDVEVQRVLAFVVREATTNILRHSDATEVEIGLGSVTGGYELVVTNNGVAGAPSEGHAADATGGGGSGLAGLRERITAVGGTLEARAVSPRRYVLRVWVPEGGTR